MRIAGIFLGGTLGAVVLGCGAEPLDDYSGGVPGAGGAPGSLAIATGGTRDPGDPGDRASGRVVSCCMMNEPCIPLNVELCMGTLASVCQAYEGHGEVCGMCDDSGNPDICCCTITR